MIKFWGMLIKDPTEEEVKLMDGFITKNFGDKPKRFYNFDTEGMDKMPEVEIVNWAKRFINKVKELKYESKIF